MTSVYSTATTNSKFSVMKRTSVATAGVKNSEIRQRVLSARLLRFKTAQNQITMAQQQIHELQQENRSLKTIVRRQERALDKYDHASAELPTLLKSHQEEVRVWSEKSKVLHKQIRELTNSLKQRDQAILTISDQNKHLHQLNRDKHLEDREKLTDRVSQLELGIKQRDNEIKLLARKNQLDTKMLKSQLHQEQARTRELQSKWEKANMEVMRLNLLALSNCRSHNLRETRSAATTYNSFPNCHNEPDREHLKVHSSNSFFSKSPVCDSYRNEILYEDEGEDVEVVEIPAPKEDAVEEDLIEKFDTLNRNDIEEKEQILDTLCDSVIRGESVVTPKTTRPMDAKSKTKLLAALKAIDNDES